MCVHATMRCDSACRAIHVVRQHSRGPIGLDARDYLIRVERWLMAMTCQVPFAAQASARCPLTMPTTTRQPAPRPALPATQP